MRSGRPPLRLKWAFVSDRTVLKYRERHAQNLVFRLLCTGPRQTLFGFSAAFRHRYMCVSSLVLRLPSTVNALRQHLGVRLRPSKQR
ncbi:unnamed protein product [Sphagnum troendelagicum]